MSARVRTRRLAAHALAALAGLSASPALAQTDQSGRAPARADERALRADPAMEARRVLQVLGRCLVWRDRARSRDFAAFIPGTPRSDEAVRPLRETTCMADSELRSPRVLLWGAVNAALYEQDFARRPIVALTGVQIEADQPPGAEFTGPDWQRFFATHRYANCVTRLNPAAVRGFVLSAVGSAEEDTAVAALGPDLGACLASGEVRFTRDILRAYLSGALYQLTLRASATGASVAANEKRAGQ